MQVSVASLVEVMRGDTVTLDCTPLGDHDQLLKWFLVSASGWGPGGRGGGSESQSPVGLQTFLPSSESERPYACHLAAFPFYSWGN